MPQTIQTGRRGKGAGAAGTAAAVAEAEAAAAAEAAADKEARAGANRYLTANIAHKNELRENEYARTAEIANSARAAQQTGQADADQRATDYNAARLAEEAGKTSPRPGSGRAPGDPATDTTTDTTRNVANEALDYYNTTWDTIFKPGVEEAYQQYYEGANRAGGQRFGALGNAGFSGGGEYAKAIFDREMARAKIGGEAEARQKAYQGAMDTFFKGEGSEQWAAEFGQKLNQQQIENEQWDKTFGFEQSKFDTQQANWLKDFDFKVGESDRAYALAIRKLDLQSEEVKANIKLRIDQLAEDIRSHTANEANAREELAVMRDELELKRDSEEWDQTWGVVVGLADSLIGAGGSIIGGALSKPAATATGGD